MHARAQKRFPGAGVIHSFFPSERPSLVEQANGALTRWPDAALLHGLRRVGQGPQQALPSSQQGWPSRQHF